MDADLQTEARKAVAGLDLAAWERVRALMLRAGATESEESAGEKARAAETFLKDVKTLADSVLLRDGTDATHLHGGAATEPELIQALLRDEAFHEHPGHGGTMVEYLKSSDVAVVLNRAFGITGWSLEIESLRFIERPHAINSAGVPDATGRHWNAVVVAVVALTVVGPGGRSCKRHGTGVGQAVAGRARSSVDAVSQSLSEAVKNGFKAAAKFMGPATGLTLRVRQTRAYAPPTSDADLERLRRRGS